MTIDAGIYSQIKQPEAFNPLAEMAQFQQLQGMQTANKLAQLGFADRERGLADAEAQRVAVRGFGGDAMANYNRLLQTGNLGAAQGYLKGNAELGKLDADVAKTRADTTGKAFDNYRSMLGTVQTPEQAAQFLAASHADPTVGPILQRFGSLEQGLARIPRDDPAGFAQWKAMAAIGIEKLADQAKVSTVNLGGTMETRVFQPATGQTTIASTAPVTQSPDNAATNARSAANNAATVDATMRGQILTDERGRELAVIARDTAATNKAAAADTRKAAGNDKAVRDFTTALQKEGIPELETAISGAEGAMGRYKKGEVPGIGPLKNAAPAFLMSDEGKDVRQALAAVKNIVLNARSGAAVTDQELRRLVEEIGSGVGMTEADARRGLAKIRQRFDAIKDNAAAGVSDETLATYGERGGVPIKRGATASGATGGWDAAPKAPKPGEVQQGYVFTGGNPADKKNWRRQ